MQTRRGVGVGAAVLLAIVAVLGTTLYFVTGHVLPGSQVDNSKDPHQSGLPAITNPTPNNTPVTNNVLTSPINPVSSSAPSSSTDITQSQLAECAALNPPIPQEQCNEQTILAQRN